MIIKLKPKRDQEIRFGVTIRQLAQSSSHPATPKWSSLRTLAMAERHKPICGRDSD